MTPRCASAALYSPPASASHDRSLCFRTGSWSGPTPIPRESYEGGAQDHSAQSQRPYEAAAVSRRTATSRDLRPITVIADAPDLDGGLQGLGWCAESLAADDDGDLAHGFIIADQRR